MKNRETGKRIKRILKIILFVLIGLGVLYTFYFLYKKSQPKKIVYEIVKVEKGNVEKTSVATGNISPRDEILIKPQISGIIAKILKEAGDHVKVGDILATVNVVPDVSQLSSAESRINIAQINLQQIQSVFERQKQLYEKGVIASEEMEQAESDYSKAKEELSTAHDSRDIIVKGISEKTAKYSSTQIRSTITGMILDVPIKAGNSVIQANTFNDGTTIASVADMSDMLFIGNIDETEVGRIHVGMPVKLSIGAIEKQSFDAKLEYISPKGVETNGAILFEIKAAAAIPDTVTIRAGYSANAEIMLDEVKDVLTVPESTLSFSNDSAFVYILKDSVLQIFDKKFVEIGLSDGIKAQVKSGLTLGDQIRGNEDIDTPKKPKKD